MIITTENEEEVRDTLVKNFTLRKHNMTDYTEQRREITWEIVRLHTCPIDEIVQIAEKIDKMLEKEGV